MTLSQLLEVQRLDVEAEQLRHRRAALPQRDELSAARQERAVGQADVDAVAATRVEVVTRQKRFEDEAQIVASRAEEDESRLYSGEISAMKDLQALQDEITGLRRRQGELEDRALEAMEEAETLTARAEALEAGMADVNDRISALTADIEVAEADIDEQLLGVTAARDEAASQVEPEVLAEYERLRAGFGSATVVRFDGGNCVGCPSTMPAVEADRMKHAEPGSLLTCQECGRMVVR